MTTKLLLGRSQRSATARTCRAASFGEGVPSACQLEADWRNKSKAAAHCLLQDDPRGSAGGSRYRGVACSRRQSMGRSTCAQAQTQARRGACTVRLACTRPDVSLCDAIPCCITSGTSTRAKAPSQGGRGRGQRRRCCRRPQPRAAHECPYAFVDGTGYQRAHGCLLGRGLALLACAAGELSAAAHLTAIAGNELSEGAPAAKVACVS